MPVIVEGPKPRRATCDKCAAVMEYLPEEVYEYSCKDISGVTDTYRTVKCPRPGCPGHGHVR